MVIHEMRWRMDSWHLCWLSMWIRWRYLPLREMDINVEMQTLSHTFPSEGMLPCNRVLIGWLHRLPSEQQPSPSFTEQWPSCVREVRSRVLLQSVPLHARRWRLVPELIRYMQDKV